MYAIMNGFLFFQTDQEKNLGVIVSNDLKPMNHDCMDGSDTLTRFISRTFEYNYEKNQDTK